MWTQENWDLLDTHVLPKFSMRFRPQKIYQYQHVWFNGHHSIKSIIEALIILNMMHVYSFLNYGILKREINQFDKFTRWKRKLFPFKNSVTHDYFSKMVGIKLFNVDYTLKLMKKNYKNKNTWISPFSDWLTRQETFFFGNRSFA